MAKSSRASRVKKNNQNLKKKVFGPVEAARNERLGNKLLELARQPKPPRAEMEVEQDEANGTSNSDAKEENIKATEDVDMDADEPTKTTERSNRSYAKQKAAKVARIEKRRARNPKNSIVFPKHPKKARSGKK